MTLTSQELQAGISRRALATLRESSHKSISEIVSAFTVTRVIDTPMRMLDVLESKADGAMCLRYTEYQGDRAHVWAVPLNYHEAHQLSNVLRDLEPPEENHNGNGKAKR